MDRVETLVVGAGVVGLAIARALAASGREVVILERAKAFGTGTSSRNSEVIHAGIYYAEGSLKAELCVQGRQALYDYCQTRGVAFKRCGKLIVAPRLEEQHRLERIVQRAERAGVRSLQWLSAAEARALEPELAVGAALLSPQTGIIDSHGLMLALLGEAQDHGAVLALDSGLAGACAVADGFECRISSGPGEPMMLYCRELINSAGLYASEIAGLIEGLSATKVPATRYAKGHYFTLMGRSPFTRLVYPTPDEASLGVHLTLDLAGRARFGPDVQWVESPEDYDVPEARGDVFYPAIRAYWPGLPDGALAPAYAGIRPKLVGPRESAADFRIDGEAMHGVPGLVNLFGIESPGLTASLAIAERVEQILNLTR
jgi:L-2-hydroxyglutarate oxidase LhgO